MPCKKGAMNFKKLHFEKKQKNLTFSNHCQSRFDKCISMKLGKIVYWTFAAITNKSTRICLNNFGDTVIQSLKRGKLADLLLLFTARLGTWPKAFYSYSFNKFPRNEAFRHFLFNFIKWLPWKR